MGGEEFLRLAISTASGHDQQCMTSNCCGEIRAPALYNDNAVVLHVKR